jgi:hypothetical protein
VAARRGDLLVCVHHRIPGSWHGQRSDLTGVAKVDGEDTGLAAELDDRHGTAWRERVHALPPAPNDGLVRLVESERVNGQGRGG